MSATLTDRYIEATVRTLPVTAQEDVRAELAASIADDVDARLEQGQPADVAEREVLTALGDPSVLAARYADHPLHLIGPRYYLAWWRLLKLLLAIVPACVVAAVALGQALSGAAIGTIVAQAIATALGVAVHLAFWVTLVFVILERTGADTGLAWSLDDLPDAQDRGRGVGDLVASLVFLALMVGALLWDHFRGVVYVGGEWLPLLHPELWPGWTAVLLALVAGEVALAFVIFARGWSPAAAVANAALAVVVLSLALTGLGRGVLVNPELVRFLTAEAGADVPRILAVILGFTVAGVCVWDGIDGFLKARRAARG
jgi:hypothetical protein